MFHLVVEGLYAREYWLHLALSGNARFEDLDGFLRGIWLECCDHLSEFTIAGRHYCSGRVGDDEVEFMSVRVRDVLEPGLEFGHEYDYGSTTTLRLRVVGLLSAESPAGDPPSGRELARRCGADKPGAVLLLARNEPPQFECVKCKQPASHICVDCSWDEATWLCGRCRKRHECGEDMTLPIANSPRVGVCAYTGA